MSNVTDINEYKKKRDLEEVEERTAVVREKVGKIAEGMKALREAEQQNAENEARLKKMRKDYNKRTSRDYGLDKDK